MSTAVAPAKEQALAPVLEVDDLTVFVLGLICATRLGVVVLVARVGVVVAVRVVAALTPEEGALA